nr:nitroreductase family deazaflavin-dependent oxidoreductase [Jiangella asiatica]
MIAPWMPGFGMLTHRGRSSGRVYRIPIMVFRVDSGFAIALTYGADTDWVKNVLAAGGCELQTRLRRYHLVEPRLVHDEDRAAMPVGVRQILALQRVDDFLFFDAKPE